MKAPEKIYITDFGSKPSFDWHIERVFENDIEYTRTDAFIEKIKEWLNKRDERDCYTIGYIKKHFEEIIKEIGL